ncbi:hypothetical protein EV368DRAFT_90114 [Lentinula lateritia]|nr:hypothetical protein EV368DRAFT_90114 [Lentinula lateritia]
MLLPRESINALLKAWKYFIDDPEALIFEFLDVVNQNTLAGSTKYNFQMCYVDALTEEIQENKELPDLVKGNFGDSSDESENNEEDEEEQSEGEKEAKMLKKQGHKKQAILSASHIVVNENEINLTSLALLAMISDELQTPQSQSWLLVLLNY